MTSLLSFSWRKNRQSSNHSVSPKANHNNIENARVQDINDPWGLGIATSTSSAESITPNHNSEEQHNFWEMTYTQTSIQTAIPSTPEGLRPRKSVLKLRQELLGCHQRDAPPLRYSLNERQAKAVHSNIVHRRATTYSPTMTNSASSRFPSLRDLDFEQHFSPQMTMNSSVVSQEDEDYSDFQDESYSYQEDHDYDIVSMAASPSLSPYSRRCNPRLMAVSPDLKPGKAKTAVGALVAQSEHQRTIGEDAPPCQVERNREDSQHSILPSRDWMDSRGRMDEDDTIREDQYDRLDDDINDDNESSLHASPSSLQRDRHAPWKERQQDTSFTRNILTNERQPYDFGPILVEEMENSYQQDSIGAPRVLAIVNDNNGLNVSAISSSYHPRDLASLHSLADTMDDELEEDDEDYDEINRYQPLIDEKVQQVHCSNGEALVLLKAENQRRVKEDCLLSTIERLSHDLGLLKEFSSGIDRSDKSNNCPSPRNHFFLGLNDANRQSIQQDMETMLSDLVTADGNLDMEVLSLRFCLSILQKSAPAQQGTSGAAPKYSWKSVPGLRSALGLKEDPVSPPTVRGGDSSLFSLPSESAIANDDTPHTSNVSMATTITTVLSPDKNSKQWRNTQMYRNALPQSEEAQVELKQTFESVIRLLGRLEATCLLLQTLKAKRTTIDEIKGIYLDFLKLPIPDLRCISSFFDLSYEHPSLSSSARTVSEDEDVDGQSIFSSRGSIVLPPPVSRVSRKDEILRINVIEDNDDGEDREPKVECDLWTPTTEDMNSTAYIPLDDDDSGAFPSRHGIDDLRRTVGSFDLESVAEEREDAPSWDEEEEEDLNEAVRTNGANRHGNSHRHRNSKPRNFWKGRILGSRQRQYRSTE